VRITPEREMFRVAADIPLPREAVWDYLIQPEHYNVLVAATKIEITDKKDGRVTLGSAFQCYHGDHAMALTVLEWQPFELITTEYILPAPAKGAVGLSEIRLTPIAGGTKMEQVFSKITGPLLAKTVGTLFIKGMSK
jgi:uncharacterized protein YndB with AHSA1/START domain